MIVRWNDSYRVGVSLLDEQHRKLFQIIEELYVGTKENHSNEIMGKVLNELLEYAITHLRTEELVLQCAGYPDFDAHKKEHDKLIADVNDLMTRFESDTKVMRTELMGFIQNWLTTHIAKSDKKYGPYLNGKGAR